MPGEQIDTSSDRRTPHGLHLIPCAVIAGVEAHQDDDRLMGAQSALNRIQAWVGDIFINLRRRQQVGRTKVSLDHGQDPGLGSQQSFGRHQEDRLEGCKV
jgi:hypothetical protein